MLKSLAYDQVPRALLERPKPGFGIPLSAWLRTELHEVLHEALAPARLEPFGVGNGRAVARLLQEHESGRRNRERHLWALMVLGLWDNGAGGPPRGACPAA